MAMLITAKYYKDMKTKTRALIFFVLASTLILSLQSIMPYSWGNYRYGLYAVVILIAGLIVCHLSVTYYILSLVVVIPLGLVAFAQLFVWLVLTLLICLTEILILSVGFIGIGITLRGTIGGIIGFLATISTIFFFGTYFSTQIGKRWDEMWKIANVIGSWWIPYPGKLMNFIWSIGRIIEAFDCES